jgi:hypothetical protein
MKSHLCEFAPKDLLRLAGLPLLPLALFAGLMHLGSQFGGLPAPRPTLDTERTILIHQAEASRSPQDAEVLLLGDSSCLMNVSARQLSEHLARPVLNLGTFSFLDLNAHALLLRNYAQANPGRLRVVALLMHPESLRRAGPEGYYVAALTNFLSGFDHGQPETFAGQAALWLGVDIFNGRILSRVVPGPLPGAYGRRYGFSHDLEGFLDKERGSAIDPDPKPFEGTAEYRLAPTLERASRRFRAAVPTGVKLLVGITPAPERFVGQRHSQIHGGLLSQWAQWLQADAALTNLPPTLPDASFVRTTHLKESVIPRYTEQLAAAVRPHLRLNLRQSDP